MKKLIFLVMTIWLAACGTDHDSKPQPVPTPAPTPEYELALVYDFVVDEISLHFGTEDILVTGIETVDSYFLAGELRQGMPETICQAQMRLRHSGFNSYHLLVVSAHYSEFEDEENELCALFNGTYYVTLTSDNRATIRRY